MPTIGGKYRHRYFRFYIQVVSIVGDSVVYVYDPDRPMGGFIDGMCSLEDFPNLFEGIDVVSL